MTMPLNWICSSWTIAFLLACPPFQDARADTLKVSLNGRLLYEAKNPVLKRGRIGFYANQGRAT